MAATYPHTLSGRMNALSENFTSHPGTMIVRSLSRHSAEDTIAGHAAATALATYVESLNTSAAEPDRNDVLVTVLRDTGDAYEATTGLLKHTPDGCLHVGDLMVDTIETIEAIICYY